MHLCNSGVYNCTIDVHNSHEQLSIVCLRLQQLQQLRQPPQMCGSSIIIILPSLSPPTNLIITWCVRNKNKELCETGGNKEEENLHLGSVRNLWLACAVFNTIITVARRASTTTVYWLLLSVIKTPKTVLDKTAGAFWVLWELIKIEGKGMVKL